VSLHPTAWKIRNGGRRAMTPDERILTSIISNGT
jgi:hypothetical protein